MYKQRNNIKVFVASVVYGVEDQLNTIYSILDGWGYDVINSHKGTVRVDSAEGNLQNCLNGVDEADVFIGFIRPNYGSGVLEENGKSITHCEIEKAYKTDKLRFMLVDYRVPFVRNVLAKNGLSLEILTNKVPVDKRCIELYNYAIKDNLPANERKGNWVQSFYNLDDIRMHLEAQLKDPEKVKSLILLRTAAS